VLSYYLKLSTKRLVLERIKVMDFDTVDTSWCEIFPDRIAKNLRLAKGLLPDNAEFCAVLKADAYGHGIATVVPIICAQNVKYIGITSNAEARAVRNAGFKDTLIRVRSATRSEIEGALPDRVQEQVSTLYAAQALLDFGLAEGVHLALNAGGMSRDGLELSGIDGRQTCLDIIELIGERIVGICTHFPSNLTNELLASNQYFENELDWIFANSQLKRHQVTVNAGSSLSLVSGQKITTDLYRCGAILYGILNPELGFEPTMQLKARITSLNTYPSGSTVGYDRATLISQDRRLANISIGYSNGIKRNYFDRCSVLIRGQLVPILGKISMNSIVADVTDLLEVEVEDEVVIFGKQGTQSIGIDRIEQQAETIVADTYAEWGQRNQRVYL
jgi:alanine racemase